MRILVFGGTGIVGRAVVAEARRRGWPALGLAREQADITESARVERVLASFRPDLVVNCAAFTKVDACESEPERAWRTNGEAAGTVAAGCAAAGARLIHLSTDYVFAGDARAPYREEDATGPCSVYGASKLDGERRALAVAGTLVVRTSWVFGVGGANFVDTIRGRVLADGEPLRVVDDQRGAPTYAPFLARALADLGESGASGIVHYRNREPVTWYEFAREIVRMLGRPVEIRPASSAEVPRPAPRPAWSVLAVDRFEQLAGRPVEDWRTGLALHLARSEERE